MAIELSNALATSALALSLASANILTASLYLHRPTTQ
jgi:hypothetical protein